MVKIFTTWVCVLVIASAFALPALADQSIGYQDCFKKGVKAFYEHDDQEALRYFKIAHIFDPTDE